MRLISILNVICLVCFSCILNAKNVTDPVKLVRSTDAQTAFISNKKTGINAENPPIACSVSVVNSNCYNDPNGSISVTSMFSGSVTYTIMRTNSFPGAPAFPAQTITVSSSSYTFNNLYAGHYNVTAMQGVNSCTFPSVLIQHPPGPLSISANQLNPLCSTEFTGVITLIGSWSNAAFTNVYANPNLISSVTFTLTGPNGPYPPQVIPYNGQNLVDVDFENLSAGTYGGSIKINSCTLPATISNIILAAPSPVVATVTNFSDVTCFGGNNGTIQVTGSGGTPAPGNTNSAPYRFRIRQVTAPPSPFTTLSGIGNPRTASNLLATTYQLRAIDDNGCSATTTHTILQPGVIVTPGSVVANAVCNGGTGSARWQVTSGGTPPFTISLDGFPGQTQTVGTGVFVTFNNLPAGNYTADVIDAANCVATNVQLVVVNQPAAISASISNFSDVSCFNGNNGTITVKQNPGSGVALPFTYRLFKTPGGARSNQLAPVGASPDFDLTFSLANTTGPNIVAGSYFVRVSDANGCTFSTPNASISQPNLLVANATQVTNLACFGNSNGAIDLSVTGGTAPFSYQWTRTAIPANVFVGSTQDLLGLIAGQYNVTVTDGNLCTTTLSVAVTQPSAITATTTVTNIDCFGNSNGAINLTPSGGTFLPNPPYSVNYFFDWSNDGPDANDDLEDLTGLTPGTYTVTITDGNGCEFSPPAVTISQPMQLLANANYPTVSCQGGEVTFAPTGGTGPYFAERLNCNNGNLQATSPVFVSQYTWPNLGNNTRCFRIVDNNGCQTAMLTGETVNTNTNFPASAAISFTNVLCNGANNGTISVSNNGFAGFDAFSYTFGMGVLIDNVPPTPYGVTFPNVAPGSYTVTITNTNVGCTLVMPLQTITQPAAPLALSATQTTSCTNAATNTIDLSVTGGTPAYTYDWSNDGPDNPDNDTQDLAALSSGTYTVTVTDANLCSATLTRTVGPLAIAVATQNVLCQNGSSGSITLTVTGGNGNPSVNYDWADIAGTNNMQNRTSLIAGTYFLTATSGACTVTKTVVISQPNALVATISSTTPASCFGGTNGSLTMNAMGGTALPSAPPAYNYLWSNGATTRDISNVAAGSYSITVTDFNLCTATTTGTVIQPTAVTSIASTTPANCGAPTGTMTATPSGGTPGYTYAIDGSPTYQASATFTGLNSGSHTISVKDANGCLGSVSAIVLQNASLVLNISAQTNVNCFGNSTGSVSFSAAGGTGSYQYRMIVPSIGAFQNSNTFVNLTAGNYTIEVKDNGSCTATVSVVITGPASALLTGITTVGNICNGNSAGSVDLTVSGGTPGYSYIWNPGGATTQDIGNLTAGTYNVTVTDTKGCTATNTAIITQPTAISATATATNVLCNGASTGAVALVVSGGTGAFTFLWNNGQTSQNLTNLLAGSYSVTVTDFNGCTKIATATVTQPANAIGVTSSNTNVSCFGGNNGSASVVATGGTGSYSYAWLPGGGTTATINTLTAGTYNVTITDGNGCTRTASATVSQPAAALFATATPVNISCGGGTGSISVNATGGTSPYFYSLNGGAFQASNTFTGLAVGNYSIVTRDANLCTTPSTATITQTASLTMNTTQVNVTCAGDASGSITANVLNGTPPFQYRKNGGAWQNSNVFGGLIAGSYLIEAMDASGCSASATIILTQNTAVVATATSTNPTCNGQNDGSITASGSGGVAPYSYRIGSGAYQNSPLFSGLGGGTYVVQVKDANSCVGMTSATVIAPAVIVLTSSVTNVSCNGGNNGAISITATGGTGSYQYKIGAGNYQNSNTFTNLAAGAYLITVKDGNNCLANITVSVLQPAAGPFNIVIDQTLPVTCIGGTNGAINITVSGCGPFTFLWTKNNATVSTSEDLINISAGTYNLKVTDGSGNMQTINGIVVGTNSQTLLNLLVENNNTCSITLKWDAMPNTTGYEVEFKTCAGSVWTPFLPVVGTSATITGLNTGTCYDFRVRFTGACNGAWTYQTAIVTATFNPPVNTNANVNSNSSATVTWAQSTCVSPSVANVELRYRKVGTSSWTVITLAGSSLSHTLNGLVPGMCYEYRLRNKYIVSGLTKWSNFTPTKKFCLPSLATDPGGSNLVKPNEDVVKIELNVVENESFDSKISTFYAPSGIDFTLFPNPASDFVTIRFNGVNEVNALTINVLGIDGRLISTKSINESIGQDDQTLDVSHLAPGFYLVEVRSDAQRQVQKLIKE